MGQIEFKGKTFEVDEDGFIASFDTWSPGVGGICEDVRGHNRAHR